MFLSQIEKKMPGTTTGVVEPAPKKPPAARIARDWTPQPPKLELVPDPAPEPLRVPVDVPPMADPALEPEVYAEQVNTDIAARTQRILDGKQTRTCGIEIPLDVHVHLVAEAKQRGVSLKSVVLEHILAEHNRRQMR